MVMKERWHLGYLRELRMLACVCLDRNKKEGKNQEDLAEAVEVMMYAGGTADLWMVYSKRGKTAPYTHITIREKKQQQQQIPPAILPVVIDMLR